MVTAARVREPMTVLRTKLPFVHSADKGANGPDRPFAARHDAAPRFPESAVHARRSNPILEMSGLRTKRTRAGAARWVPLTTPELQNSSHSHAAMLRTFPRACIFGRLERF